jgi:hypothetical protein
LPQVIDILNSAQHPVIGRLAKYHLDAREDSKIDQMKFYEYLNDNFFIISARRFNAFEQAISWSIVGESKKLNVYSVAEKQAAFNTIYKNGITIDQDVFKGHLWSYMEYEKWSAKHFNVSAHFYYDRDFENVEEYILKLSAFAEVKKQQTWKDFSGLDFHDWNRIHYLTSVRKSTINVHDLYSSHDILMYSEFDVKLKELLNKYDIHLEGNVSSHMFRKTLGNRALKLNNYSNESMVLLMELFNHSSPTTTKRYLGVRDSEIQSIYDSLKL